MYLPPAFEESRPERLHALMRERPFATVMTAAGGLPEADHLPLLFSPPPSAGGAPGAAPHGVLRGHVARANPLWRRLGADGLPALAVFHGPQGYVSPSWYASKARHGKAVPTWNYIVVHARGRLRAVDDAPWLRALLTELSAQHEAGRAEPWHFDDAPADFMAQLLGAVVGIELEIESLQGKAKLSQNRDAADRAGVIEGLAGEETEGAAALRRAMRAV